MKSTLGDTVPSIAPNNTAMSSEELPKDIILTLLNYIRPTSVSSKTRPTSISSKALGDDVIRSILHRLPPETLVRFIIPYILQRLPPETLIRFMSVKKSWYSSITSPNFVRSSIVSSKRHSLVVMTSPEAVSDPDRQPSYKLLHPKSGKDKEIRLPIEFKSDWRIVGSVNGLVCVVFAGGLICLWNPCIRIHVTIHPSSPVVDFWAVDYGFGFDPITNDYKVVSIKENDDIEIYSLNSGSWKKIMEQDVGLYEEWSRSVCLKGVIYWVVVEGERSKMMLFDIQEERFLETNLPNYEEDVRDIKPDSYEISLQVVNESIYVLWSVDGSPFRCSYWYVWILKEDGSWIRYCKTMIWHPGSSLELTPEGEILVQMSHEDESAFLAYNPDETVCFSPVGKCRFPSWEVISITDSLALLDRRPKIHFP